MGGRTVAALSIVAPSYRLNELKTTKIGEDLARVAKTILTTPSENHEKPLESMDTK
jgi:urocanate hydratase